MINLYWPIYKNLESEFNKLMFEIHINDEQLKVYSPKIGDLITRAVMDIESITNDLYFINGGIEKAYFKYDEDGLKYLEKTFALSQKVVNITSTNCYITDRVLIPFKKNETRTNGTRQTYSWNNAYQNIKHDRAKNLRFASIKYLFDAMAALYLLNIYFKDEEFDVGKETGGLTFPHSQGSDIFSIMLYTGSAGLSVDKSFHKSEDFNKYVYRVAAHDNATTDSALEAMKEADEKKKQLLLHHVATLASEDNSLVLNKSPEEIMTWIADENQKTFNDFLVQSMGDPLVYSQKLLALTYKAIIAKEPVLPTEDIIPDVANIQK